MSNANERRAQYWQDNKAENIQVRGSFPNGQARSQPFGAEFRASAEPVIWNGGEKRLLEGYASIVGRKYPMWDMFGEYEELIMPGAFDKTLSQKPDVAYLVNHRGVTMARTTNGNLELRADGKGLLTHAYLNPKRVDVQDLLVAVEDKDVTEMSFAFMITDGEWNEEFTEYQINEVDLDRGDVSAVNFGANPYTSVKARQQEVIRDFALIPRGAQEAALRAAGIERGIPHVSPEEAHELLTGETERTVDKAITDPHTLYVEQWLTQEMLSK